VVVVARHTHGIIVEGEGAAREGGSRGSEVAFLSEFSNARNGFNGLNRWGGIDAMEWEGGLDMAQTQRGRRGDAGGGFFMGLPGWRMVNSESGKEEEKR